MDHKRKDPLRRRYALAHSVHDLVKHIFKAEKELKNHVAAAS